MIVFVIIELHISARRLTVKLKWKPDGSVYDFGEWAVCVIVFS